MYLPENFVSFNQSHPGPPRQMFGRQDPHSVRHVHHQHAAALFYFAKSRENQGLTSRAITTFQSQLSLTTDERRLPGLQPLSLFFQTSFYFLECKYKTLVILGIGENFQLSSFSCTAHKSGIFSHDFVWSQQQRHICLPHSAQIFSYLFFFSGRAVVVCVVSS